MSSTDLVVLSNQLVVADEEPLDLLSHTLEGQSNRLNQETIDINHQNEFLHQQFSIALNRLSFEFPALAHPLREAVNELALLRGMPQVPSHIDPVSQKDTEGKLSVEAEALQEAAAAEEERTLEDMLKSPDGKVLQAQCKNLFRWISSKTHPDRCSDRSIHHVFDLSRKAFKDNNLQMLRTMKKQLKKYLKVRKKNKSFRQYMEGVIQANLQQLEQVKQVQQQIRGSLEFRCYESMRKSALDRQMAYSDFVNASLHNIHSQIEQLNQQRRMRNGGWTVNTFGSGVVHYSFTT